MKLNYLALINSIFTWSGAKFYMNWLLPTNPMSRNPIIKLLYGFMRLGYTGSDPKARLALAYFCGIIHAAAFIFCFCADICLGTLFSIGSAYNFFVNFYPMIVQLYIGYRCYIIIKHRNSLIVN